METTRPDDATQLNISRRYRVAPEKVWRAWTDPQALSQWFGLGAQRPATTAEVDLRVGGRYRIAFAAPDGDSHEVSGVYQEVLPHRRLVFTWAWKSTPERVSRVSIELRPLEGGTELSLVHDRFFDTAARNNHQRGWLPLFEELDAFFHISEPA